MGNFGKILISQTGLSWEILGKNFPSGKIFHCLWTKWENLSFENLGNYEKIWDNKHHDFFWIFLQWEK